MIAREKPAGEGPASPLYRTGAGYPVMIAWTVLLLVVSVIIVLSLHPRDRVAHAMALYAWLGFVVLFGPVCLTIYLIRRRRVFVIVDDEKGVLLRGEELIPWERIQRVQAFEGLGGTRTQKTPVRLSSAGGVHRPQTLKESVDGAIAEGGGGVGGMPLYFLLAPIISLFTPWHPKVVLWIDGRRPAVFHELERDLEFCFRCVPRIREARRPRRELP